MPAVAPPNDAAAEAERPLSAQPAADAKAPGGAALHDVIAAEARREARRKILWFVWLGLLVAAAGTAAYVLRPKPIEEAAKFRTARVSRGDVVHTVSATGRLESRRSVQVGAEISGRIAEVLVDYDEQVEAGQVLLRFETESLRAQVAQVKAQLKAAQAALAQAQVDTEDAERQLSRSQKLFEAGADSAVRREQTEAQVKAAKARVLAASAQVELQRASYELAQTNLAHTVVRAPISGVVISRAVEPGQTVAAALQSPVLFLIAEDLREMRVLVAIDEADVGVVKVGQAATFTVDAYPTETFAAEVHEIRSAPTVTQGVVTYEAVLFVDNQERKLKPGMTASVKVRTQSSPSAQRVPNAALRFIPPGSAETEVDVGQNARVWQIGPSGPTPMKVRAGVTDGTYTAIEADDLPDGSEVIVDLTPEGRKAYGLDDKRK